MGGSSGQCMVVFVRLMTVKRSVARVERERSSGGSGSGSSKVSPSGEGGVEVVVIVVEPWPRASRERMPALGRRLRISELRTAKERPEEPAPWCVTKRGPLPTGDVR